ncbi:hypothetical protein R69919_04321 [Paraburkholderia gardini]|uniref:Uncharacterized protein n=1 Tax=Paraburkholderia gardini TaxID=2823469 RepID=A0ABN7QMF1_9BURK|nr:hypothetical protein R54767_03486 [Paraburkholderia gardini]CAG4915597.1 hypothetical protein R69919_04321 [Paraburkholderia gardini]
MHLEHFMLNVTRRARKAPVANGRQFRFALTGSGTHHQHKQLL